MSYHISEDMELYDFDTVIEVLDDFIIKLNPDDLEPDEELYPEYQTEEYKAALATFCKEAKERIAKLETLI